MVGRFAIIFSAAWLVFVFVAFSDAGVDLIVAMIAIGALQAWGPIWLVRLISYIIRLRRRQVPRQSWLMWCLEPAVWLVSFALVVSGAPSRLRFHLSETALHGFARSVVEEGGEPFENMASWRRIGLYAVKETELLPDGIVRVITSSDGMADDAGFVYSPHGEPPVIGEDYYRRMHGPWWHWERSW